MRNRVPALWVLLAGLAMFAGGRPGAAAEVAVDLELVLAVDVSLSMDLDEQRLQRQGYVAAFRDPEIAARIQSGVTGRIAVVYIEWAGTGLQRTVVPWTLIDSVATARAFADQLERAEIARMYRTSISDALRAGVLLFRDNGYAGARRVIDVSGDGPNNAGLPVMQARDAAVAQGIIIHGLPILLRPDQPAGFFDLANLDIYYEDCVIGGFGAFVVPVRHVSQFASAIRRKLLLEISDTRPRAVPARLQAQAPRIDCLIGEKLWLQYLEGGLDE